MLDRRRRRVDHQRQRLGVRAHRQVVLDGHGLVADVAEAASQQATGGGLAGARRRHERDGAAVLGGQARGVQHQAGAGAPADRRDGERPGHRVGHRRALGDRDVTVHLEPPGLGAAHHERRRLVGRGPVAAVRCHDGPVPQPQQLGRQVLVEAGDVEGPPRSERVDHRHAASLPSHPRHRSTFGPSGSRALRWRHVNGVRSDAEKEVPRHAGSTGHELVCRRLPRPRAVGAEVVVAPRCPRVRGRRGVAPVAGVGAGRPPGHRRRARGPVRPARRAACVPAGCHGPPARSSCCSA